MMARVKTTLVHSGGVDILRAHMESEYSFDLVAIETTDTSAICFEVHQDAAPTGMRVWLNKSGIWQIETEVIVP
jgi:hypothetical protein